MRQKVLVTILSSLLMSGLLAMNAQAHTGESGKHYVVDSSGSPVKSSSGDCVVSSGTGGGHSDACGGEMAKAAPAPMPAAAPAPAPAPAPAMMPVKTMGASHTHPANHCTNSISHSHAGPGGHTHRYSCKRNTMASPKQMTATTRKMAAPRQRAY